MNPFPSSSSKARLAVDFPLVVETVDLGTAEGQVLALQGGMLFPPGIFLDGRPISYGRVSERKLRRELVRRSLIRTK